MSRHGHCDSREALGYARDELWADLGLWGNNVTSARGSLLRQSGEQRDRKGTGGWRWRGGGSQAPCRPRIVLAGPIVQSSLQRAPDISHPTICIENTPIVPMRTVVLAVEQRTRLRRIGRSIAAATGRFAFQRACRDRREITPEPQEKCGIDVGATAMGATDCASGCHC